MATDRRGGISNISYVACNTLLPRYAPRMPVHTLVRIELPRAPRSRHHQLISSRSYAAFLFVHCDNGHILSAVAHARQILRRPRRPTLTLHISPTAANSRLRGTTNIDGAAASCRSRE